ncbi:hypothetical protein C8R45DRAFT_947548 [Mycena sanguinolenta]|nr:hypothetical protein C8R45DRAFT_947548 [Mycena sanguinolenta]
MIPIASQMQTTIPLLSVSHGGGILGGCQSVGICATVQCSPLYQRQGSRWWAPAWGLRLAATNTMDMKNVNNFILAVWGEMQLQVVLYKAHNPIHYSMRESIPSMWRSGRGDPHGEVGSARPDLVAMRRHGKYMPKDSSVRKNSNAGCVGWDGMGHARVRHRHRPAQAQQWARARRASGPGQARGVGEDVRGRIAVKLTSYRFTRLPTHPSIRLSAPTQTPGLGITDTALIAACACSISRAERQLTSSMLHDISRAACCTTSHEQRDCTSSPVRLRSPHPTSRLPLRSDSATSPPAVRHATDITARTLRTRSSAAQREDSVPPGCFHSDVGRSVSDERCEQPGIGKKHGGGRILRRATSLRDEDQWVEGRCGRRSRFDNLGRKEKEVRKGTKVRMERAPGQRRPARWGGALR